MRKSPIKYSWKDITGMSDDELIRTYRKRSREARDAYRSMKEAVPTLGELNTHKGDFRTIESMKNLTRDKLEKELLKTENYLGSSYSDIDSYEQMKAKSLRTLHGDEDNKNVGYKKITEENFEAFANYMDELRKKGLISEPTSSYYAEQFENVNNTEVSKRIAKALEEGASEENIKANLEYWAEQEQEGRRLYYSKKRKRSGSKAYKK